MCGIAGILSDTGPVRVEDVARMAARQAHRGPDDSGTWVDPAGRVAFGHARLAILDLTAAGHQPMTDETGRVCLVFNGEIYNFRELRAELEHAGHRFVSDSDTEVILRGYLAWGDGVIPRLRGMFAFGLWDAPGERLLLVRDRLGIKPLHWADEDGVFSFASELKGLEAGPPRTRTVDPSALWDFLTYQYVPCPKTVLRGVHKLPPGHLLIHEGGHTTVRAYWDVSFDPGTARSAADWEEELRARLRDSVRAHLVSDVPVGVLLSGGVDSSAVTAFAAEAGGDLRSYCVGFGETSVSEARFARAVAQRFGTRHVERDSGAAREVAAFADMAEWFDEPFGDTSALPTALVCRVAREGVKVVLSGDGGDELFGGYRRYGKFCRQARSDVAPRGLQRAAGGLAARGFARGGKTRRALQRWGMDDVARYAGLHGGMTAPDARDRFPRALVERYADYDPLWHFRAHWREEWDPWSRMQYLDLKTYLPDDLLTKVDRVSMRVSLEVRPPLLDHGFVEFAASMPAAARTPDGVMKGGFKSAMRGILGPESLDRGKQGFSIPLDEDALFASSPESAGWPRAQRTSWGVLKEWTRTRLGVADPREILREGP